MEAWILIGLYVLLLVVLQVVIYGYLRTDGERTLGGRSLLDGPAREEAEFYNGTTPPREYARSAETGGETGDSGVMRCPHCGSATERAYTYCWNCIGLVGR